LLKAAVADAIQGAGPVLASHLSAGLDSGVVTSIAADLRLTSTRLIAFTGVPGAQRSYSFSNRLLDEGNLASQAARYMPSVEHRFISALGDPIGPLFTAADLYQQPLANPFNAGWFSRIQDESSEAGARTLLIGQLGNYSFSMSGDRRSKIRTIAQQVRQAVSPPGKDLRSGVFLRHRPNATSNGDPASTLAGAGRRLNVLSRLDPGTLLRGTRRHWGLDLRDPYADRRLVEFSLRIPEGLLCALGERGLARAIGAERLPASVLEEPRRGYQSADWVARLKAHTESASMLISRCWDYGDLRRVLDLPAMQRAIQRLERSQRITAADEWLYRTELPRTLALAAFVQSLQP
jgi:asparagine synthase (glutamine-hydrolysing)